MVAAAVGFAFPPLQTLQRHAAAAVPAAAASMLIRVRSSVGVRTAGILSDGLCVYCYVRGVMLRLGT